MKEEEFPAFPDCLMQRQGVAESIGLRIVSISTSHVTILRFFDGVPERNCIDRGPS